MNITLRQLEIFWYVATYGSITKTAEILNLTQPAVSLALKELENQIGEPLFERVDKKLILNDKGKAAKQYVKKFLGHFEELKSVLQSKHVSNMRIGASTTIGNYILPELISNYMKEYPNVKFNLFVSNTENILKKIDNFEIDIGFIEGVADSSKYQLIQWMEDELVIFSSITNPIAENDILKRESLRELRWVLREKGSGTREVFEHAMMKAGINYNIALELGNSEAIKSAVVKSDLFGCLSKFTLEDISKLGKIKIYNSDIDLKRNFYIVLNPFKFKTAALENFLNFILNFV
ncbi:transcriptional regulator, LysR family [Deferribacter desulfuricans SSM1]|uniref:Transcriptional regulator, LysR family n=1 Tax=Deferribacter desulfuricans (strain DSM 14783 / JCM 11476 / NBRC 101012 / SSM1) TaxID=639282 RepID=D3PE71_DEFDS|nr:LysR substrate-binding domain-containing protein [Deferribacter desulfuricans]BAI80894.1 transcriptional regulator, LysR family [Deferribacter desulfuricans SSM1]